VEESCPHHENAHCKTRVTKAKCGRELASRRRRILLELVHVLLLDLLHHCFSAKKIRVELPRNLLWYDEELVSNHLLKRNRSPRGNEMRSPLDHQAYVPEDENGKESDGGGEHRPRGAEELCKPVQENAEAENEERCERNEKAVAVRRNAGPVGVAGDEKIKRQKGGEKGSAGAALPSPEDKEASDGKKKNGRPGDKPMIGREKYR
jgi:hypothetical protein